MSPLAEETWKMSDDYIAMVEKHLSPYHLIKGVQKQDRERTRITFLFPWLHDELKDQMLSVRLDFLNGVRLTGTRQDCSDEEWYQWFSQKYGQRMEKTEFYEAQMNGILARQMMSIYLESSPVQQEILLDKYVPDVKAPEWATRWKESSKGKLTKE